MQAVSIRTVSCLLSAGRNARIQSGWGGELPDLARRDARFLQSRQASAITLVHTCWSGDLPDVRRK